MLLIIFKKKVCMFAKLVEQGLMAGEPKVGSIAALLGSSLTDMDLVDQVTEVQLLHGMARRTHLTWG